MVRTCTWALGLLTLLTTVNVVAAAQYLWDRSVLFIQTLRHQLKARHQS